MMIDIDVECCIGCAACAELCPEIFAIDERTGKARVITFEMSNRECIEEAITTCPVECISWQE